VGVHNRGSSSSIEYAERLDEQLLSGAANGTLTDSGKSELARTLAEILGEVDQRITAADTDPATDLPEVEGVKWDPIVTLTGTRSRPRTSYTAPTTDADRRAATTIRWVDGPRTWCFPIRSSTTTDPA
jgi:hypothetical protein